MKKKPYIPRDFQVLSRAEESAICTSCALAECVGVKDKRCPARRIDRVIRSRVRKVHQRQQKADRESLRGYWPEIHGEV